MTLPSITHEELQKLRSDLPLAAEKLFRIRTKEGQFIPFRFNKAQQYIHERLEAQKRQTGRVRALILKGRQQGCSTYVAARFYHKAAFRRGVNVYILAHERPATDNLFGIVDRYHRNNPLKPSVGTSNEKELVFDRIESSYCVATAGQKAGGRSRTIMLFHGSEAAFWPNAADHFASSVQGVADVSGSEIILESTANGVGGEFYERWQDAIAGRGDYQAIFVPWFWSDEYTRPVPEDFKLDDVASADDLSEAEYAANYGVSHPHMAWRRAKIAELRSSRLFDQEYPASQDRAFIKPDGASFISDLPVIRARKRAAAQAGPLIIGVDPASGGGDRFAVAWRRGFSCYRLEWRDKIESTEGVFWLRDIIDRDAPAKMFIDYGAGGGGSAVVSGLKSLGPKYAAVVEGVNFGSTSQHKLATPRIPGPVNRRAEMWQRMKDWLSDDAGVSLPDIDALQADLTAPAIRPRVTGDFVLESKQDLKKRGVRSTDLADALCLTFASLQCYGAVVSHTGNTSHLDTAPRSIGGDPSDEVRARSRPLGWMIG